VIVDARGWQNISDNNPLLSDNFSVALQNFRRARRYVIMVVVLMEVEIITVILGALLGAFISLISFTYKSRVEMKAKVNKAIFNLLEVWSLIGMTKALQSEEFSSKFMARMKYKFPKENIDKDTESAIKSGLQEAIPTIIESQLGGDDYLASYSEAVKDLAPIYPIYAFQLNKNQILIKYLKGMDSLIANHEKSENDEVMIESFKEYANQEAFGEFEKDLKSLSKKAGLVKSGELIKFIDGIKYRVGELPEDIFDSYINSVFAPAVQKHYDRQGVKNPNIIEQA